MLFKKNLGEKMVLVMKAGLFIFLMLVGLLCAPIQALYVEPKTKPNPGIVNQNGNDCFFNSSMQILTNLPNFDQLLTSNHYQENSIPGQVIVFQNALRTFDATKGSALGNADLISVKNYGSKCLRSYIVENTSNVSIKNMRKGQQDAQEFLSYLIDEIADNKDAPASLKDSFQQMFRTDIESSTACSQCGSESNKEEQNWLLSLPFPPKSKFNLPFFVENYLATENFEEYTCEKCNKKYVYNGLSTNYKWTCGKCGGFKGDKSKKMQVDLASKASYEVTCDHGDASLAPANFYFSNAPIIQKKFSIKKLPQILILSPKRFNFDYTTMTLSRIDTPVAGPEVINLIDKTGNKIFHLVGRVNHYGGVGGGHYTAYVRDLLNGQWYLYDDSTCNSSSIADVTPESKEGYIFFYVREGIFNAPYVSPVNEVLAIKPKPIVYGIDNVSARQLSTLQTDTDEKKNILQKLLKTSTTNDPKTKDGKTVFDLFNDFIVGVEPYREMIQNFDDDALEDLSEGDREEFFGEKDLFDIVDDIDPKSYFNYFQFLIDNFPISDEIKQRFQNNGELKRILNKNTSGFTFADLISKFKESKIPVPATSKDPLAQKLEDLRISLQMLRKKLDSLKDQLKILKKNL